MLWVLRKKVEIKKLPEKPEEPEVLTEEDYEN